jgi:hypothetical protein
VCVRGVTCVVVWVEPSLTVCARRVGRLLDVVHIESSLTLVFEFMDEDLRMHIDRAGGKLEPNATKVRTWARRGLRQR